MKYLHDGHGTRDAAIDQRLLLRELAGQVDFGPVRALAERLLYVDHNEGGIGHAGLQVGAIGQAVRPC
jgi:hypothetical protein